MVAELELQHYQVKVGYLGFMNQYFICVQLIDIFEISKPDPLAIYRFTYGFPCEKALFLKRTGTYLPTAKSCERAHNAGTHTYRPLHMSPQPTFRDRRFQLQNPDFKPKCRSKWSRPRKAPKDPPPKPKSWPLSREIPARSEAGPRILRPFKELNEV